MAFLEKHLYIKRSTLPDAGKGLFTKVAIKKGTRIVEYKGKRTVWKKVKDDEGNNPYIFYVNRNNVIDSLNTKQYHGRYINDARGAVKIKGLKNNCEYEIDGKRCFVNARKDIPARSELFVSYGPEYWQVMRENWKIEARDEKDAKKAKEQKAKEKAAKKKQAKKKAEKKALKKKRAAKKKAAKKKK